MPNDQLLRLLIDLAHEPMVSTSINISLLPAEEDYHKIVRSYRSWFDVAIHPAVRSLPSNAQPSTIVEYIAGENQGPPELKCLREGSIPFMRSETPLPPQVTFVCTANICRSPMAEKLFDFMAQKRNLNIRADSCGLIEGGHMISTGSLQLLLNQGILEAQSHVSKQITPQIVSESWLMLTMEERQRDFIRGNEPHLKHKIFTLNEMVGEPGDIEDPTAANLPPTRRHLKSSKIE